MTRGVAKRVGGTGQIWASKFACERGSVACGGPGKFDVYTARFLQNCYKFDAKLSSQNAVKSSRGYFGNLAKFAIIARK